MPTVATLSAIRPSNLSYLGLSRQPLSGAPQLPGTYPGISGMASTIPLDKSSYQPEDTPHWLMDTSIRGSMAQVYSLIQGPEDATFSYGGPFYGDIEGYFFDNTFGDLSSTGSSPANGTTLSANTAVGATTATITSITGYGSGASVQVGSGSIAEVVVLSAASAGSTITFANTPLRFPHNSGGSVWTVTGPYTHRFAILQQGSWNGTGQPPLLTATDYTGFTPTTGSRSYSDLCCSQIDLTGNTEQLFEVKVSGNSWLSQPAAGAGLPVNAPSQVVPVPAWESTIQLGGSALTQAGEWAFSIKRQLQVYWTTIGAQNPFVIARGSLDATGSLMYTAPQDESALTQMINNTQPPLVVNITNGLSGTAAITCTITSTVSGFTAAKPNRGAVLIGYDDQFQCVANSTDTGGSGGLGPMTVTLTNNVPTY